ncbi:unnamed protein product [Blepharisma stoltei]|uniref:Uncharacterized protein n=1 Tax=Blepharisma stoltei TaxID=1481888 RepID=A0AAU9IVQ4_9CILI|nr:unnamed protein product [Blepharisma stoltei]
METGIRKRTIPKITLISTPASPKGAAEAFKSTTRRFSAISTRLPNYLLYPKILSQSPTRSPPSPTKHSTLTYRAISQDSTGCHTRSPSTSIPSKSRFSELCKIQSHPNLHGSKTQRNRLLSIDHIIDEIEKEKLNNLRPCYDKSKQIFKKLENELKESANLVYEEMMMKKRRRYMRSMYIKVEPSEFVTIEGLKRLRRQLRNDMKKG